MKRYGLIALALLVSGCTAYYPPEQRFNVIQDGEVIGTALGHRVGRTVNDGDTCIHLNYWSRGNNAHYSRSVATVCGDNIAIVPATTEGGER